MRVVLIGAGGQLGTDLAAVLQGTVDLQPLTHADLDITNHDDVQWTLRGLAPDLVINTAAYNRVDDCEQDPSLALGVNAAGPHNIAHACQSIGARLLHVSTDYVFSGERTRPWTENDRAEPLSMYGVSKLAGELAVRAACPEQHYIVRVSGLFGLRGSRAKGRGGNFVETMLRLQSEGRTIRVVNDQTLAPTCTLDLALKLREFVLAQPAFGTYHMASAGSCTWYEFARAIFDLSGLPVSLEPQSSTAAGYRARRPRYSVLANDALADAGIQQIRPWYEGLRDYLAQRVRQPEFRSQSSVLSS